MQYVYIGKIDSAKEFQTYIALFEQRGVQTDNVIINVAFDKLVESLNDQDTIVVGSYVGLFSSLSAYLTTATKLIDRGITLESLLEPDICVNHSNYHLIRAMNALSHQLRSYSSLKSVNKAKAEGKKLGRPLGSNSPKLKAKVTQVDKLAKDSNISISKACAIIGCLPGTYYRIKGRTNTENNTSNNLAQ